MKKMENNARVKIIVTGRQEEESRINYTLNKRSILSSNYLLSSYVRVIDIIVTVLRSY